ncbi:MAG: hypothetical protein B6D68_03990 [spirochete symbiont of Stewartia floridana]|nr:MAG: hypothetical protein B6D68_03990 [spirochete symbiont of Stewartia floridana]
MNDLANKSLRLGVIGAIAALLLAVVNSFTSPVIARYHQEEVQAALRSLAGDGSPGALEENPAPNVMKRWSIEPAKGWILEIQAKGYGGEMTLLASYNADGSLITAKLLSNNETVGFGKKAEAPGYMDIFAAKGADSPVPLSKADLGEHSDVVSGATVTFLGISKAILMGSNLVKQWEQP